jgi:hypothetical protein
MVTIDFYNYPNRTDTVNKTLTGGTLLQGLLFNGVSVLHPVLKVRTGDFFSFNYCFIHELNRYYYVDSFNVVEKNVYELHLTVDVLKTYETEIMNATGTVDERENADGFISSRRNVFDVRPNFERIDFDKDLFDADGTIIMVTLKS